MCPTGDIFNGEPGIGHKYLNSYMAFNFIGSGLASAKIAKPALSDKYFH